MIFPNTRVSIVIGLLLSFLLLAIFSCNINNEGGHTYLNVKMDSAWTKFDSLEITWNDSASGKGGILFQDNPNKLSDINKLLADGYEGQKIRISIKGFKAHQLIYQELRVFDSADPAATNKQIIPTDTPLNAAMTRPPRLTPIMVNTFTSIYDSITFASDAALDSGSLKGYAWDYDGDGKFEDSNTVTGKSAHLMGGFRYHRTGRFTVTLKAISESDSTTQSQLNILISKEPVDSVIIKEDSLHLYIGGASLPLQGKAYPENVPSALVWLSMEPGIVTVNDAGLATPVAPGITFIIASSQANSMLRDSARIVVKRDVPILNVGRDTSIKVGDSITFLPLVTQEYGGVKSFKWDLNGDGTWDDSTSEIKSKTYLYPDAKEYAVRFYVRDSEGNDTIVVRKVRAVKGPVVLILEPRDNSYFNKTPIDVSWSLDGIPQIVLSKQTLVEGANTVTRTGKDSAGNTNSYSITVYLDTQPPNKPVVKGLTVTNSKTPTWTWSTGGGGNGKFRYRLDNEVLDAASEVNDTSYTPLIALKEDLHVLIVQERDLAGNWSASGSLKIRIDLTPPSAPKVNVATPSPTNNPKPSWSWTGDAVGGMGTYRFRLDTNEFSQGSATVTQSGFTPARELSEGMHTLYVQERDTAGNWSTSGYMSVQIDKTGPSAPKVSGMASPTNNSKPSWTWTGDNRNGRGIFRLRLDTNDFSQGSTTVTQSGFTPTQDLLEGVHTLFVQEQDASGNWSESESFSIRVDLTPPNPPTFSASPNSPTNDRNPKWTWTSSGSGGMAKFRVKFPGATDWGSETSTVTFSSANLNEGNYTLAVQERDSAGNWSNSASASVQIDLTPPNSVVFAAKPLSPLNSLKPVWTWSSGGGGGMGTYRYKLDDTNWVSGTMALTGQFTPSADLTEALHNLNVQERDSAGNWSAVVSKPIVVSLTGVVGTPGFSLGEAHYTSLAFSATGVPYIAYVDDGNAAKATVMRLNGAGSAWELVGTPGFSQGKAYYTCVAFSPMGIPYVAYQDAANGDKVTVMRFNSAETGWEVVGMPGFSMGKVYYTSLAFSATGVPYIAFADYGNNAMATVMRLNGAGSAWEVVGTPDISQGQTYYISLALSSTGVPYVAYQEWRNNNRVTVRRLNETGTGWEVVGTPGFSQGSSSELSLVFSNTGVLYVAFTDAGYPTVMRLNEWGTGWEVVGAAKFSPRTVFYTSLALSNTGVPYVAYNDGANGNKATVMRFNSAGTGWEVVGKAGFSAGPAGSMSFALSAAGVPYVAYRDGANGLKATVMKTSFDP